MATKRSMPLPYADRFAAIKAALPGRGLPWVAELREGAIERFRDLGLPTIRVEEWKFTSLRTLAKTDFHPAKGEVDGLSARAFTGAVAAGEGAHRLVFVNGRFRADLSDLGELPAGVEVLSLAQAFETRADLLEEHLGRAAPVNGHALVALNTAFMADGCVLRLKRGAAVERPVHLVFIGRSEGGPVAFHPRVLVVAERGSSATLIESHLGAGRGEVYWSNPTAELSLEEDAELRHYKFQNDSCEAFHIAFTQVNLGPGARYENFSTALGGALARNEINTLFGGERGEIRLKGLYMLRGRQHADTTTVIDHAKPRCTSREVYKGVLDEHAHGVFQGRITVRPHAQKTDGHQLSRTLLLSDQAQIDTKPELEIYADDVKCSHGATAGELEEDALFYLRTRGLDEARARSLLIEAFLSELVDEIGVMPVREHLRAAVAHWLADKRTSRGEMG